MDTAGRFQVTIYATKNLKIILLSMNQDVLRFLFHQIDKAMMDELKEVKRVLNPTEVLLVVDAMTGQEAAGICTCIC